MNALVIKEIVGATDNQGVIEFLVLWYVSIYTFINPIWFIKKRFYPFKAPIKKNKLNKN